MPTRLALDVGWRRRDERPLLAGPGQQPVEPDSQAEAGLNRFKSGTLRRWIVRNPEIVVDRPVTHTADMVEGLADVTVQEALSVQSAEPVDLPARRRHGPGPAERGR